jgi:hypothetical protein
VSLNCLKTVSFVSKSQSLCQTPYAELSQIDKFELTISNLETEPTEVEPIYKGAIVSVSASVLSQRRLGY